MNGLTFKIEGLLNSFRQIDFKTYHKTYLCPTKWNILGLLTNISGETEKFYYDLSNKDIDIQIKILNIGGFTKDLWHIKDLKQKTGSIIRRDKIFKPIYEIDVICDDAKLIDKFYNGLLKPKRVPSLGMDDEIVKIFDVKKRKFEKVKIKQTDKILFFENIKQFKFIPNKGLFFRAPKINRINQKWNVTWQQRNLSDKFRRNQRKTEGNLYFLDFYGGVVEFEKEIEMWE